MRKLLKYFENYRLASFLGPIFKLIETILELIVPLIVAMIIDIAIPSNNQQTVIGYIGIMFLLAFVGLLFSITAQFASAKAATGFTKNMTSDLYRHVMSLPKEAKDKYSSASMVARLTSDSFQIQGSLNMFFRLFLRSPFVVLGSLFMAIRIDSRMTWIYLTMIIILTIIVFAIIFISNPLHQRIRQQFDGLVGLTQEQIKGMRVIRAFRQQKREISAFKGQNAKVSQSQLLVGKVNAFLNPLTYVVVNTALIMVIWQGGDFVFRGDLTQGQLVALINYLSAILVELVKFAYVVTQLNKGLISGRRIADLLEIPSEEKEIVNNAALIEKDKTAIRIKDLEFTYPNANKPSLEDIDFAIMQGDFIGIIGSTGSGKSTLLQMITKSYNPSKGNIVYNPKYFNTESIESLRDSIAVVPSQVALFKGSIRSNILMGNPQATDEMIWQALADAQADEFVKKYPEGLDKEIEAFGRNFSGGQRQRLTIARALIKDASVIIFDDSTSALDYITEANFQKTLKERYSDRTIIMISQRTHSLQQADNILVLEEGRQLAFDKHDNLLKENQVYQEIYASQTVEGATDNG